MITEYKSNRISGTSEVFLKNVMPEYSKLIGIVIQSHNDKTGTVTIQTEAGADRSRNNRVLFIDYIDQAGFYSGDSAKDFFETQQNLGVKITGGLEITVMLLIWKVDR